MKRYLKKLLQEYPKNTLNEKTVDIVSGTPEIIVYLTFRGIPNGYNGKIPYEICGGIPPGRIIHGTPRKHDQ